MKKLIENITKQVKREYDAINWDISTSKKYGMCKGNNQTHLMNEIIDVASEEINRNKKLIFSELNFYITPSGLLQERSWLWEERADVYEELPDKDNIKESLRNIIDTYQKKCDFDYILIYSPLLTSYLEPMSDGGEKRFYVFTTRLKGLRNEDNS